MQTSCTLNSDDVNSFQVELIIRQQRFIQIKQKVIGFR